LLDDDQEVWVLHPLQEHQPKTVLFQWKQTHTKIRKHFDLSYYVLLEKGYDCTSISKHMIVGLGTYASRERKILGKEIWITIQKRNMHQSTTKFLNLYNKKKIRQKLATKTRYAKASLYRMYFKSRILNALLEVGWKLNVFLEGNISY